jgi:sphingosine kinase
MDLREPLLQESTGNEQMTTCSDWPAEAAGRAKLYIPPNWPGSEDTDATCVVSYDANKKLICIKDSEGRVLDVIDPLDVIGADLEIKLFGPTDALEHVGFRNTKVRVADNDINATASSVEIKEASKCNIFKPLEQNVEKIFSLVDNAEIPFDTQATAILNIYAYPRKHPSQETWGNWCGLTEFKPKPDPNPPEPVKHMGNRYAHQRRFEVVPSEDFADIRSLVRALRSVSSQHDPPTRYIVFLNPMGGQKKAQVIYDTIVSQMLEQACVDHDLVVTTHARHAEDYIMSTDFDLYDGFIAMGGDGLIHEVLQGIQRRSDADAVLKKLKMGVIGCGTCNGLAKSILHESEVRRYALLVVLILFTCV